MADRPCPNCAQPVPTGFITCPHCGMSLGEPLPVQPPTGEPTGVPWRASEAFIVFFLHLLATAAVVGVLATQMSGDPLLVWAILISEIILILTTLAWVSIRHGVGPRALGLRNFTAANLGIGIGAGLLGLVVAGLSSAALISVLEALRDDEITPPDQIELATDPEGAILLILGLSVVLMAPIAEETFFRGFLFAGLRRWARVWPAVLISSAVFAVTHLIPLVMLPIFALGVLLAWLVEIRRSLAPAIVAHLVFNGVGFWLLFVAEPVSAL